MAFKVCVKRTFVDVEEVAVHSTRTRASSCPARYSKVSSCTTSTQTPKACKASQTMTVMSSSVPWHWGLSGVSARGLVESMANLNARLRASHGCDANPVGNEMKSCKLTKPPLRALRFHELLWPPVREHANVQDEKDSQDSEERQEGFTRTTASLRKPKKNSRWPSSSRTRSTSTTLILLLRSTLASQPCRSLIHLAALVLHMRCLPHVCRVLSAI